MIRIQFLRYFSADLFSFGLLLVFCEKLHTFQVAHMLLALYNVGCMHDAAFNSSNVK